MNTSRLFVEDQGSGPAVVLLHGAPVPPEHLRPLATRLGATKRALLVHLPGYGESPELDPYDLQQSHALVEETLIARGIQEADFVGYSGGAYRAFAIAARGRIRARRIVALAGFANVEPAEKEGFIAYSGVSRSDTPIRPILREVMLSARGKADPAAVLDVEGWADATDRALLAEEFMAFSGAEDLRPMLARLGAPTLVRVGTADGVCPVERSERIVAALGSAATFEKVDGVGHAILLEDFEATVAAILRHLG